MLISFEVLDAVIVSQILAWSFVRKLGKLAQYISKNSETILLDQITKYAILSVITVMFSTITTIIFLMSSVFGWSYWYSSFTSLAIAMDVVMHTVCTSLTLETYNDAYAKYCKCCDVNLKKCCANMYTDTRNIAQNIKFDEDRKNEERKKHGEYGEETAATIYNTEMRFEITQTDNEGVFRNTNTAIFNTADPNTLNVNTHRISFTDEIQQKTDKIIIEQLNDNQMYFHGITKGNIQVNQTPGMMSTNDNTKIIQEKNDAIIQKHLAQNEFDVRKVTANELDSSHITPL